MPAKAQAATTNSGTVTAPDAFAKLVIKMAGMATLDESEGRVSGQDIIPILEAESEEEMWDADERPGYNAKVLSGCELNLYSFEVKFGTGEDSDIKTPFVDPGSGRQMYILIESARISDTGDKRKEYRLPEIGERFVWNTSARNIVGKLFWMLDHGWFDSGRSAVQVLIKGTPLGGGRSVEKLKKLPGVAVNASAETPF
jgi:hypothetical protein